ncbi:MULTISPECIES: PaaI family thioesterase [unclassified Rhizobium]|uniref:PaaI family thioesterase n=1 Tax=unclassified Rhizobium TaxID=2613769 RepID=UPI00380636BF
MEFPASSDQWTRLDSQGFSALVGPIFGRIEGDGRSLYRLDPQEHHRNRSGVVHGGVIMTLADIAAANTLRGAAPDCGFTTVQTDVHFMRAASVTLPLTCECVIDKLGLSLAFVEVRLTSDEQAVAIVRSIWRITEKKGVWIAIEAS